jgi:hypothetical protein
MRLPGIEQEDVPFRYRYFSGSKEVYVAPHAPFYLKVFMYLFIYLLLYKGTNTDTAPLYLNAYDLDGHQMTQFSPHVMFYVLWYKNTNTDTARTCISRPTI